MALQCLSSDAGMSRVARLQHADWRAVPSPTVRAGAAPSLEAGDVLFLSELAFETEPGERALFSPDILRKGIKNISFDPASGQLGGTAARRRDAAKLGEMIARFTALSHALVGQLCPGYGARVELGRASFRPAEIAGRESSWRKDDTRLHIDSFPASPVHGKRILRVFSNVNRDGRARSWRIGEEFECVARRFAPALRMPLPGSGELLRLLRVTHTRRSAYDALMLQLHDRMKADMDYQVRSPQMAFDFPAGTTWIAFTDQVSHAATAGQYQLEQTFLLPVDAMLDEHRSPLRVLERVTGTVLT